MSEGAAPPCRMSFHYWDNVKNSLSLPPFFSAMPYMGPEKKPEDNLVLVSRPCQTNSLAEKCFFCLPLKGLGNLHSGGKLTNLWAFIFFIFDPLGTEPKTILWIEARNCFFCYSQRFLFACFLLSIESKSKEIPSNRSERKGRIKTVSDIWDVGKSQSQSHTHLQSAVQDL